VDLEKKLLDPMKVKRSRYQLFRSNSPNPERECERMARWLAANGPIDVCILGLGLNGHVAMNEPNRALNPYIHVATLARSSSRHPMLKSAQHRPRYGLTLGLHQILSSRKILLLVSGEGKRPILKKLLQSPVTTNLPASFLWLHPNTTVLCDQAALGANRL
jgi:galactosamine-6-phosphate isomerase